MHIEWFETLVVVEREGEQSLHFPSTFTTLSHPSVLTSSCTLRHQEPQRSKQAKDKEKQSESSITSNKFGNYNTNYPTLNPNRKNWAS
jgi:hypothetical protein